MALSILASYTAEGQTAVIPITTITSTPAAGMYRISVYLKTSDTNINHNVRADVDYVDTNGIIYPSSFGTVVLGGQQTLPPIRPLSVAPILHEVHISNGSKIHITTSTTSVLASPYDVYVVIEQLF